MESYDTAIVGAGLAGLQCARLLSSRGISVLLIDRQHSLSKAIRTTGIFVRKTLEDFDIPDYCLGPAVKRVSLYSPALRLLDLESVHDEFRIGKMANLYEHYLNQCVANGVKWEPAVGYLGHQVDRDDLILKLAYKSQGRNVRTRYLVGADGARSRVAANLHLDRNKSFIVGVEQVFMNVKMDEGPRLLCFIDPKLAPGYIGWVAYDGDEAHVGVAGYPDRFNPMRSLREFRSKIASIVDLKNEQLTEQRVGTIPIGGVLRQIANRHGLLIGDAAGAVSPLTAGGLDGCMRLSTFAANTITDFLQTGDESALDSYSGEKFRARFASRLWARRLVSHLNHSKVVELGFLALSMPMFRSLARHIFFSRGSFPDMEPSSGKRSMQLNNAPGEFAG